MAESPQRKIADPGAVYGGSGGSSSLAAGCGKRQWRCCSSAGIRAWAGLSFELEACRCAWLGHLGLESRLLKWLLYVSAV